jgi:hypothetical protein
VVLLGKIDDNLNDWKGIFVPESSLLELFRRYPPTLLGIAGSRSQKRFQFRLGEIA